MNDGARPARSSRYLGAAVLLDITVFFVVGILNVANDLRVGRGLPRYRINSARLILYGSKNAKVHGKSVYIRTDTQWRVDYHTIAT